MKKIINIFQFISITIGMFLILLFLIPAFCGIKPFVVLSGSMEKEIKAGAIAYVNTHIKVEDIKVGDVIAFDVDNTQVTHRVIAINDDFTFTTKGDANENEDLAHVSFNNYRGKTVFSIPYLGRFIYNMQTRLGYFIMFVIIGLNIVCIVFEDHDENDEKHKCKHKYIEKNLNSKRVIIFSIISVICALGISFGGIFAYYTANDIKVNKFKIGDIDVTVSEPSYAEADKNIVKPKSVIPKDPTLQNSGKVPAYLRAQIYMPVAKVNYIGDDGDIVFPESEIELFKYEANKGWELVDDNSFSGDYVDDDGNKYKVFTYKWVGDGESELVVNPGQKIETPVFSSVTAINYVDMDKEISAQIHVCALGVQIVGGTADELWSYYVNQNNGGILGV